jgi:hypothetical protein
VRRSQAACRAAPPACRRAAHTRAALPLPPLQARVIGQDDACDATARAIMRASSGLKNPDRPIATLMFSGPTGVGKTELTKVCGPRGQPREGGGQGAWERRSPGCLGC